MSNNIFFNPKYIILKIIAAIVCVCFLWQNAALANNTLRTVQPGQQESSDAAGGIAVTSDGALIGQHGIVDMQIAEILENTYGIRASDGRLSQLHRDVFSKYAGIHPEIADNGRELLVVELPVKQLGITNDGISFTAHLEFETGVILVAANRPPDEVLLDRAHEREEYNYGLVCNWCAGHIIEQTPNEMQVFFQRAHQQAWLNAANKFEGTGRRDLAQKCILRYEESLVKNFLSLHYGRKVARLEKLPYGIMNEVFLVEMPSGEKAILKKFFTRRTQDEMATNYSIITYLIENKFPAARPILTVDGQPFVPEDGDYYMLSEYVKGKTVWWGNLTVKQKKNAMRLLATYHRLMENFKPAQPFRQASGVTFVDISNAENTENLILSMLDAIEKNKTDDEDEELTLCRQFLMANKWRLQEAINEFKQDMKDIRFDKLMRTVIHGDYQNLNLRFGDDDEVTAVVDWDFSRPDAPRILDLASTITNRFKTGQPYVFDTNSFGETIKYYMDASALTDEEIDALAFAWRARLLQNIVTQLAHLKEGIALFGDRDILEQRLALLSQLKGQDWDKFASEMKEYRDRNMPVSEAEALGERQKDALGITGDAEDARFYNTNWAALLLMKAPLDRIDTDASPIDFENPGQRDEFILAHLEREIKVALKNGEEVIISRLDRETAVRETERITVLLNQIPGNQGDDALTTDDVLTDTITLHKLDRNGQGVDIKRDFTSKWNHSIITRNKTGEIIAAAINYEDPGTESKGLPWPQFRPWEVAVDNGEITGTDYRGFGINTAMLNLALERYLIQGLPHLLADKRVPKEGLWAGISTDKNENLQAQEAYKARGFQPFRDDINYGSSGNIHHTDVVFYCPAAALYINTLPKEGPPDYMQGVIMAYIKDFKESDKVKSAMDELEAAKTHVPVIAADGGKWFWRVQEGKWEASSASAIGGFTEAEVKTAQKVIELFERWQDREPDEKPPELERLYQAVWPNTEPYYKYLSGGHVFFGEKDNLFKRIHEGSFGKDRLIGNQFRDAYTHFTAAQNSRGYIAIYDAAFFNEKRAHDKAVISPAFSVEDIDLYIYDDRYLHVDDLPIEDAIKIIVTEETMQQINAICQGSDTSEETEKIRRLYNNGRFIAWNGNLSGVEDAIIRPDDRQNNILWTLREPGMLSIRNWLADGANIERYIKGAKAVGAEV